VLLEAGVPENRISLSSILTDDGIGAEAPGQSFEKKQYVEQLLPRNRAHHTVIRP
jgi:hypothetical protein